MSSAKQEYFIGHGGWMRAVRHEMDRVGDVIEKYWHKGPDTEHTTIVTRGKVLVRITREDDLIIDATEKEVLVDWPAGVEYEWEALEAPVRFVHVFGPNAGMYYYNRLCPSCKKLKVRTDLASRLRALRPPLYALKPPSK